MRHALRSIENLEAVHFPGPIRPNIARNCPRESQDSPSLRSQCRSGSLPPTGHGPPHGRRQGGFALLVRPNSLERRLARFRLGDDPAGALPREAKHCAVRGELSLTIFFA
jgi:hypothetical protein